jgi:hypothetical protein
VTTPSSEGDHESSSPSPIDSQDDESALDDDGIEDSVELVDERKVDRITNLVLARVENKLEHHLHTQMELPPAEQAAALREKAPEVYQTWVDIARLKAETESYVQKAQYDVPAKLGRTGRPWALVALFAVLGFCAYVASLRGTGIYVSGIIAAIDLFSMLGLFFGLRPELMSSREREVKKGNEESNKKQLPPSSESE